MKFPVKVYHAESKKRIVQDIIFGHLKSLGLRCDSLILGGPSIDIYAPLVAHNISKGDKRIYSYEMNPDVFISQQNILRSLPYSLSSRIDINLGNILDAEPRQYIDLDLMRTVRAEHDIIYSLFHKQSNIQGTKVFNFTVAERGAGMEETVKFIERYLVHSKLEFFYKEKVGEGKKVYQWIYNCASSLYHVDIYVYKDTMPMLTCLITRKD